LPLLLIAIFMIESSVLSVSCHGLSKDRAII